MNLTTLNVELGKDDHNQFLWLVKPVLAHCFMNLQMSETVKVYIHIGHAMNLLLLCKGTKIRSIDLEGKLAFHLFFKIFIPYTLVKLSFLSPESILAVFVFTLLNGIDKELIIGLPSSSSKLQLNRIASGSSFPTTSQLYPVSYLFLRLDK